MDPDQTSPCRMSAVELAPVADNLVTTAAPCSSSANTTPTFPSRFTSLTVFLSVVSGLETKTADRLAVGVEDDGQGRRLPRDDGFFFY